MRAVTERGRLDVKCQPQYDIRRVSEVISPRAHNKDEPMTKATRGLETSEEASVRLYSGMPGCRGKLVRGKLEPVYDIERAVRLGWTVPPASHLG